jgi:hypothetical protein
LYIYLKLKIPVVGGALLPESAQAGGGPGGGRFRTAAAGATSICLAPLVTAAASILFDVKKFAVGGKWWEFGLYGILTNDFNPGTVTADIWASNPLSTPSFPKFRRRKKKKKTVKQ